MKYTLKASIGFMFFREQQARSSFITRWPKLTSNLLDLLGMSLVRTFGISQGFSYPYALKFNSALYVWVRLDWLKNLLYVTNNYFQKWRLVRFLSQESGSLVNPEALLMSL